MKNKGIYFVTETAVYLEHKLVGFIKPIEWVNEFDVVYKVTHRYFPNGDTLGGDDYPTLEACKASLL
jgi:hypothetical protein